MRRNGWIAAAAVACVLFSSPASAGVWFEVLHAPCWTGNDSMIAEDNGVIGEYEGAIDCFNKDFNGGGARTTLSIKAFQAWEYGTMFLYYDITGPWKSPIANVASTNEKGGFFGGITVTVSPLRVASKITGKEIKLPMLHDLEIKYEMEHVSKFGMLHYYGLQWSLAVPFMDFVSVTTVIRDDPSFEGVDLQLGAAAQKTFTIANQDIMLGGFVAWGVFGEGNGVRAAAGTTGNNFVVTQPQLLWDAGKTIGFTPAKIYLGFEWQFSLNRYLIEGKTENTLQGMLRWNI